MDNISVQITDLPLSVDGLTVKNEDDSYTIFLNARSSVNQQREAYEHELHHINNNDFGKTDVQSIEAAAHGKPKEANVLSLEMEKHRQEALRALKRRRKTIEKKLKHLEKERREIEDLCVATGVDYDKMMLLRAEERRLYGGM